jgi:hypothetical protein
MLATNTRTRANAANGERQEERPTPPARTTSREGGEAALAVAACRATAQLPTSRPAKRPAPAVADDAPPEGTEVEHVLEEEDRERRE